MMMRIEDVLLRCRVERVELEHWIDLAWIRPLRDEAGWQFSETDLARVELICDLHRDLGVTDDALEIILPLLDQLYAMRRQIRALMDAIGELPEEIRSDLLARISPPPEL